MCGVVGADLAGRLRDISLQVYSAGCAHANTKGIIVADTKLEFGLKGDDIILIDEVLTPDSSRFWPADQYEAGRGQASFDKQFVRDWLEESGWNKNSPPPVLPDDVVQRTSSRYIEAYERLTGLQF
jgi:phosphoribosylaminoimidazole-succinocarboxamide synthase